MELKVPSLNDLPRYAGTVKLDDTVIPWHMHPLDGSVRYWLDSDEGFRFQFNHHYRLEVAGSDSAGGFRTEFSTFADTVWILTPTDGDTLSRATGFDLTWTNAGADSVRIVLSGGPLYIEKRVPNSGGFHFSAAELSARPVGPAQLEMERFRTTFFSRSHGKDKIQITVSQGTGAVFYLE